MQVFGVDVWNGTNSQVQNFIQGGGRSITFPIGLNAAGLYGLDRHSFVIIDAFGVIQFISPQSTPYRQRLSAHEAEMITLLEQLVGTTSVEEQTGQQPVTFKLFQNSPNPFTTSTSIQFELSSNRLQPFTKLTIYDLLGRKIRTLVQDHLAPGKHRFEWHGRDANGRKVSRGLYFFVLESGSQRQAKRLLYLPK